MEKLIFEFRNLVERLAPLTIELIRTRPGTGGPRRIAVLTSAFHVCGVNRERRGLIIENTSDATVWVKFHNPGDGLAALDDYSFRLIATERYEAPPNCWCGAISAIGTAANGYLYVTEQS